MAATQLARAATEIGRHRFTVAEYRTLIDADPDAMARTELVDGEIYDLSPEYAPHARLVAAFSHALARVFGVDRVLPAGSVRLDDLTMIEPDVYVLAADYDREVTGPIPGADMIIAVEISASTKARDEAKAAVYAAADIDEYWRYDLETETFHRYTDPDPDGRRYRRTEGVACTRNDAPDHAVELARNLNQ